MTGETISHYRVLEKLGQGGMGVVYKAEDTKLDRQVALKFLPNHLLGDEEVRKRFEREAKSAAALSHSNVCTVHEIDTVDGNTFIAMELIEGESLDKKIENGPLKLDDALDIAQQIAQGLEAAHEKGVVHRDIKPQNVMVDSKGHVTIMDFGLAQLTQASLLTRPDQTLGTTFYMSPEQTEGSGTDHRTDIWSLGVVIYEMVTGQRPFKGDYDKAVMYSILNEEPEPPTALRTGVPRDLEFIVNKCLAKEAGQRYQRAAEFAVDLENLTASRKSGRSRIAATAEAVGIPSAISDPVVLGAVPDRSRAAVKRYLPWALCTVLAAVTVAGWFAGPTETPLQQAVSRFTIDAPEDLVFNRFVPNVAISPDGRHIAFVAGPEPGVPTAS